MNNKATTSNRSVLLRLIKATFMAALLPGLVWMFSLQSTRAGSATWDASPTSGDWNTAVNWSPDTVPNGIGDTASFALSSITNVSVSLSTEVNGIVFEEGASPFTISTSGRGDLTIGSAGVTNDSGSVQNFVVANHSLLNWVGTAMAGADTIYTDTGSNETSGQGFMFFLDGSSAGDATFVNQAGLANAGGGGYMVFSDHATAGNGTFINEGAAVGGAGPGYVEFGVPGPPGSTAGNGNFTLNGGTGSFAYGGQVNFYCYTDAGNATFTIHGAGVQDAFPGVMYFQCDANADNAALIAKGGRNGGAGGSVVFNNQAKGGGVRIDLSGNSTLDISAHDAPGMTIGSLEGRGGFVFLGANTLSIGSNNRHTSFLGSIADSGQNGGSGGAIIKIGNGTLVLAGEASYTGDTHVQRGVLLVRNARGSATGSGFVFVDGGVCGGTGNIGGSVIVGTGSGHKAILRPGERNERLSIEQSLILNADGTFQMVFDSELATAGGVTVPGVTINNTLFELADEGMADLASGFIITVIDNTATSAIAGTFGNLPDGGTITVGNNTFQADYQGGDGNDLTLTVVP